jgi:hypothetical protein
MERELMQKAEAAKKEIVYIEGLVASITDKGILLSDAKWWPAPDLQRSLPDGGAFIVCSTQGIVDGHYIKEGVYPRGTYEYTTVLGGRRKVKCYTKSIQDYLMYQADPTHQP